MLLKSKRNERVVLKKRGLIFAIVIVISALLYPISPLLPAYLISLFAIYLFLGVKLLNSSLIDTRFSLLLVSFFTHTALFGVLTVIAGALTSTSSLSSILYLQLFISLLLLLHSYTVGKRDTHDISSSKRLSGSDLIASFAAAVFAAALLIMPFYSQTVSRSAPGSMLIHAVGNVDQAGHTYMLNEYLELDTARPWDEPGLGTFNRGFYPSSWNAANAMLLKVFTPSIQIGTETIVAIGVLSIMWVSILMFLLVKVSFYVQKTLLGSKKISKISTLVIFLLSLLVSYWFADHLLKFGFFSFTPQIIASMLFISCLIGRKKNGITSANFGLAAFYCCVVFVSWVLLLPALLLSLGIMYSINIKSTRKLPALVISDLYTNWPMYTLALVGALAQFILISTVKPENTLGFIAGINVDGGAPVYEPLLSILLVFTSVLVYLRLQKNNDKSLLPLFITAQSLLLLISVVFLIQAYSTGSQHYYYYKCLETLLILISPLFIGYISFYVQNLKVDRLHKISVSILVPLLLLVFIPSDASMISYIKGDRQVSADVLNSIATDSGNTSKIDDVTIYLVGTNETSTIASLFTQSYKSSNKCFDTLLNEDIIYKITQTAVSELPTRRLPPECAGRKVVYKVGETYKELLSSTNNDRLKIEIIDD